jgi:hypothetical protein
VRPIPVLLATGAEGLLPKELESTDELGGRWASDLLDRLEVDAVLADLLEGDQVGRAPLVVLAELADTGEEACSVRGPMGRSFRSSRRFCDGVRRGFLYA